MRCGFSALRATGSSSRLPYRNVPAGISAISDPSAGFTHLMGISSATGLFNPAPLPIDSSVSNAVRASFLSLFCTTSFNASVTFSPPISLSARTALYRASGDSSGLPIALINGVDGFTMESRSASIGMLISLLNPSVGMSCSINSSITEGLLSPRQRRITSFHHLFP